MGNEETEREKSIRRYRALLNLAAMDKSEFDGVLRRVLETDAEVLDVERVNCWTFEERVPALRCLAAFVRSERSFSDGHVLRAMDYPRYFETILEDPILLAPDARSDPRTNELTEKYFEPNGICSLMDVPVWVRGRLWGVVCHENVGSPRTWSEAERDFALSVGHIVSMAVEASEREEAERAAHFSELFVGILSHDLRNPITTIRSAAQHLLKRTTDDFTCRSAHRILIGTEQMNRMVAQLLDFTRIRLGGGLPVERCRTDLAALCRRVVAEAEEVHPGRRVELRIEGDSHGEWDPDRLWQLLSNLMINALEHGIPDEPVWVELDGSDPDDVVVRVGNSGTVPADLAPVLFEPFHRVRPESVKAGGLGLGLFIAREIAAAHEGRLSLESREDETVFTLSLPRCGPRSQPYAGGTRPATPPSRRRPR